MLKDVSNTKAPMDVPVDDSLTPAAIQTMYRMNSSDDNKFFVPTVQVYRIKKNFSSAEGEHWSVRLVLLLCSCKLRLHSSPLIYLTFFPTHVALSDGQFYIYGICDCELVNFIHSHIIAQNSIIRVHKFHVLNRKYRGRDTKVVRLIEAAKAAPNPGYPIGIPLNIQDDDRNETEESAFVNLSVAMADGPHAVASREAFFSIRQKGRWQDDYRDFHHRRDMVKNL